MPSENHVKFLSHLEESLQTVMLVSEWLARKGISSRISGLRRAPEHEQWEEFADGGDLFIEQRIEVKRLSCDFTGAHDWPFRSDFIVCAKHAFDRASPKPHGFVIVNRGGTHAALVKADSKAEWVVKKRTDSRYKDVQQEFYFCPLNRVSWVTLGGSTGGDACVAEPCGPSDEVSDGDGI